MAKPKPKTTENEVEVETVDKVPIPTVTPSAGSAVHPAGKILQVLQISNLRLRLRHNENTDLFTIGEQYSFVTKKGVTEYPPEKVIDSYTARDEAIVAFIKKVHNITSGLVEQL